MKFNNKIAKSPIDLKHIKCGEIFYLKTIGEFSLLCCSCNTEKFKNLDDFVKHFQECSSELHQTPENVLLEIEDDLDLSDSEEETCLIPDSSYKNDEKLRLQPIIRLENISFEKKRPSQKEKNQIRTENNFNKNEESKPQEQINIKKIVAKSKTKLAQNIVPENDIFKCDLCLKIFGGKCNLKKHYKTHFQQRTHICSYCDKKFFTKRDLTKHIYLHTGKPEKCNKCEKSYTLVSSLNLHMRSHGEKLFKCEVCSKAFYAQANLKSHSKLHKTEKPYKCSYCEKDFKASSGFWDHIRRHLGEKPHKCNICDKSFVDASSLGRHKKIHEDNKSSHICHQCGKNFRTIGLLKLHMRQHFRPHKCDHCGKSFSELQQLNRHILKHTGEKPFSCQHCDKRFTSYTSMKCHLRMHTGEKPYTCEICDKSFYQRRYLQRHQRITGHSN